jgi:hypothetical protein
MFWLLREIFVFAKNKKLNYRGTRAAMQVLNREKFLQVLGLTSGAFDQLQHAGHVALAFATPIPSSPGHYLDLDLVAMAMNVGLTPTLGRENSTAIVAGFFTQWASAVGYAEANPTRDFFVAVGSAGWDATKKSPKLLLVTHGTLDQIAADFRETKDLAGFFTANVSDIIRRLRRRAREAGIDLERPFFFAPDDPRFDQILRQVERERDARVARLRKDKTKLAKTKKRVHREDIASLPRVKTVNYPIALQDVG